MVLCLPVSIMAKFLAYINMSAALLVISLLPSQSGREKIAILLGIDVDEFYPPEMPSLTGNLTTEHGNNTIGEVECKIFIPWCMAYAAASFPASVMLASALCKKSLECTIPWFICKIVGVIVQLVGFIYYVMKASIMRRVIITALLNCVYTVGSIIIVYKAIISWAEEDLHVTMDRVRVVLNIVRNFRIPSIPRFQYILNIRSNNQNVGENTADSQTDDIELKTTSGNEAVTAEVNEAVTAEVNEAVTAEVNEAVELGEGLPTELDKAEECTASAVKEMVSEESEMKSNASEASCEMSLPRHVPLGKVRFTDSVEVPASDKTEELKEMEEISL